MRQIFFDQCQIVRDVVIDLLKRLDRVLLDAHTVHIIRLHQQYNADSVAFLANGLKQLPRSRAHDVRIVDDQDDRSYLIKVSLLDVVARMGILRPLVLKEGVPATNFVIFTDAALDYLCKHIY